MRRFVSALIVASSLALSPAAAAATRPHYGGTLRVAVSAAPASLDPAQTTDSPATRNLTRLIFDTLVELDDRGVPKPALAASWESEPGSQRWQFHLRPGITFDDGTPLTPEAAAASLRAANADWTVSAVADAVVIVRDSPSPGLPAELAMPRNAIARHGPGIHGTGPFTVARWDAGKRLVLAAREDYWRGRPFINAIEIDLGKNSREQMLALDLEKLDVAEIAPEQARQAAAEGREVVSSAPVELLALIFTRDRHSPDDGRLRQALALSVDRGSLNNVLLQGGGEPARGLLPNWMTGYEFVFPASADLDRARQLRSGLPQPAPWSLGYDPADPLMRLIAERIALNARDAGLQVQPMNTGSPDLRLVHLPLGSLDARTALTGFANALGLPLPKTTGNSPEDLYAAENTLLQSQRVIPLLHLRVSYGISPSVKNLSARADGIWDLPNVWLAEKP